MSVKRAIAVADAHLCAVSTPTALCAFWDLCGLSFVVKNFTVEARTLCELEQADSNAVPLNQCHAANMAPPAPVAVRVIDLVAEAQRAAAAPAR